MVCDGLEGLPDSMNTCWPLATVQAWVSHLAVLRLGLPNGHHRLERVRHQGQVDRSHRPPRGAMVFVNRTSSGHVAVSLGNWRAVSTQGHSPGSGSWGHRWAGPRDSSATLPTMA